MAYKADDLEEKIKYLAKLPYNKNILNLKTNNSIKIKNLNWLFISLENLIIQIWKNNNSDNDVIKNLITLLDSVIHRIKPPSHHSNKVINIVIYVIVVQSFYL